MALSSGNCKSCGAGIMIDDTLSTYVCPYCGSSHAINDTVAGSKYVYCVAIPDNIADEVDTLVSNNEKIKAIKVVRDFSGYGLREAKDFIDNHEPKVWAASASGPAPAPKPEVATSNFTASSTPTSQNNSGSTQTTKKGCYVATCVYGSYDCPEVWTLRRFRDYTLDSTWYGRAFIHLYYAVSPTIVALFGRTTWFKAFWKARLDKMVKSLNNKGIPNTSYLDKY